jgi:hypothetical protein
MTDTWHPLRFIDREIEVIHLHPPTLAKKPPAPDSFVWDGQTFVVRELLSTWARYERRGRMQANMQPAHWRPPPGGSGASGASTSAFNRSRRSLRPATRQGARQVGGDRAGTGSCGGSSSRF